MVTKMDPDYLKILVAVVSAAIGWIVAHLFTTKRDRQNKKREVTTTHLIEAYRVLTHEINHRTLDEPRKRKLENLLDDVQLFGSLEQIKLAQKLCEAASP